MRKVFSQREQAVQTGLRARSYLAKEFSYERVSQTIQSEVEYLLDNR
jgi:hypothetical protein